MVVRALGRVDVPAERVRDQLDRLPGLVEAVAAHSLQRPEEGRVLATPDPRRPRREERARAPRSARLYRLYRLDSTRLGDRVVYVRVPGLAHQRAHLLARHVEAVPRRERPRELVDARRG